MAVMLALQHYYGGWWACAPSAHRLADAMSALLLATGTSFAVGMLHRLVAGRPTTMPRALSGWVGLLALTARWEGRQSFALQPTDTPPHHVMTQSSPELARIGSSQVRSRLTTIHTGLTVLLCVLAVQVLQHCRRGAGPPCSPKAVPQLS